MRNEDPQLLIDSFSGDFAFLSNFYPSEVRYQGITYPTVEHAFQAAKTLDENRRRAIANLVDAAAAKRAGRKVNLRDDWEEVKYQIMYTLVRRKFRTNPLRLSLMATGDAELVEGNWWHDNSYGDCTCISCSDIKGKNMLGRILMHVRTELNSISAVKISFKKLLSSEGLILSRSWHK